MLVRLVGIALILLFVPTDNAWAHTDFDLGDTWRSAFAHPFSSVDHFVPVAAIGLWCGFVGGGGIALLLPLYLLAAMGGCWFALPTLDAAWWPTVITVAGATLLLVVTLGGRPPLAPAALIVAAFGWLQGAQHAGIHSAADPQSFGFLLGSIVLLGFGWLVGWALRSPTREPKSWTRAGRGFLRSQR